MVETKSINCASCGAGLPLSYSGYSKCLYCGNTNKILKDGMTLVYKPANSPESPKNTMNDLTTAQKILVVGCIMLMPVLLRKFMRR